MSILRDDEGRAYNKNNLILTSIEGNSMEKYGLSTDVKPTTKIDGSPLVKGTTYFEIDTSIAFMWDATNWVVI